MIELQHEVAGTAYFEDCCDLSCGPLTIAGIDQAFIDDDTAVSGVAVYRDGECIERRIATAHTPIPYIPGLLAFRELPAAIAGLRSVESHTDVVMVDGNGRMHPREAGIATHLGVMFDIPTIGIAKSLLCGRPVSSTDNLPAGTCVAIESDESMSIKPGTVIGYALQTRQFDHPERHINPIYVSVGHRLSVKTAIEITEATVSSYKLPDPLREADRLATNASNEGVDLD